MPPTIVSTAFGGITNTKFAVTGIPSAAAVTGIVVLALSNSTSMLTRCGSKCWTSTKAIPLLAGILAKNRVNASNPPADAPMPTTKDICCAAAGSRACCCVACGLC